MLALYAKTPEIALDQKEAKLIAEAVANVGEHYDLTMDPKTGAWVNLFMVVGGLYGPRFFAFRSRRLAEKAEAKKPQMAAPAVVTNPAPVSPDGEKPPAGFMLDHMGTRSPGDAVN